jgi:hypothetical protein
MVTDAETGEVSSLQFEISLTAAYSSVIAQADPEISWIGRIPCEERRAARIEIQRLAHWHGNISVDDSDRHT